MAAFFNETLPEGVWRIEAHTLLQQHVDWVTRSTDVATINPVTGLEELRAATPPLVTKEKIIAASRAGFRCVLCLDEFDKIALSTFKLNTLFDLLDTLYANDGQIIIGSNKRREDLIAQLGPSVGPATIRRIFQNRALTVGEDGATTSTGYQEFNFFTFEVSSNNSQSPVAAAEPLHPNPVEAKIKAFAEDTAPRPATTTVPIKTKASELRKLVMTGNGPKATKPGRSK